MMKSRWVFVTLFFLTTISILLWQNRVKDQIRKDPPKQLYWDKKRVTKELSLLSKERLEKMLQAGKEIQFWEQILTRGKTNVIKEVLSNRSTFYTFDHYPKGDVIDINHLSQYYYHAHRDDEHGHFHTFVLDTPKRPSFTHLIAISMSSSGKPIKLFTVNQWVCNDLWLEANDLIEKMDSFKIELPHPSWSVNQWISSMITLFYPQIVALLQERDQQIKKECLHNKEKEILTEIPISIDEQIRSIEKILQDRSLHGSD